MTNKQYIARQSSHIEADISRNWSSFNFGIGGFEGTKEELESAIAEGDVEISGCRISSESALYEVGRNIRELYPSYWVVVDDRGFGLSCVELQSDNLEDAIEEAKDAEYWGDGDYFDASEAKLIYSDDQADVHIFEI